jgi:hypothetical protein
MKITKHISFYYVETRITYINTIIESANNYEIETDIFIHTNNPNLQVTNLNAYTNGKLEIVYHDLTHIHPYFLTWFSRDLLYKQRNNYDIFMYIEDDILVPYKAIAYWLEYSDKCIEMNFNLGFVRIEIENGEEYITDVLRTQLDTIIIVNNILYCVNNKNPYCAFWIYNKKEFNAFANSKNYSLDSYIVYNYEKYYQIREISAFGWNVPGINHYKNTLIPIVNNKLIGDCKIYHMPNNYVENESNKHIMTPFDNAINWETINKSMNYVVDAKKDDNI